MLHDILGERYAPSALLGGGGMAKVFLARDRVLGRDVALKILREQYAEDTEFVERFRREAKSVASLNHPNVVQVYDQGRSGDGRYYIAMEYVPGGTLGDRIDVEVTLDPGESARLASQVAGALQAAHGRGIVHRDVKPQNVLLTAAGEAKVADFGIARAASATSLSLTSLVLGTARYMSPEQALGEPVGPASDLYSLGVVLYEMLTGEAPFEAESLVAIAMKHVNEPPRPPRGLNPNVPEEMDALVMGLLAKRPEDRYASAAELAEDLRRTGDGLPPAFVGASEGAETVRAPAVPSPPAPGSTNGMRPGSLRRKPRLATAVALVALVALLGALGWDLSRAPEEVGAVNTLEGGPLGAPEAPEGDGRTARDGARGADESPNGGAPAPEASEADVAAIGGPTVGTSAASTPASPASSAPASSAASASEVPAPAPTPVPASEVPAPAPTPVPAPEVPASEPASVPLAPGVFPTPGGQNGGAGDPGDGGSAAEGQYE